jgi:carboxyl-terminal processing protease
MLFMKRKMGSGLLLVCLTLAANAVGLSQRSQPTPPPSKVLGTISAGPQRVAVPADLTSAQQRRLDAFMKVWTILDETYFDKTYNGLDWSAIRAEYEPKIILAGTDADAHTLIEAMVMRLGRSHFAVVPPEFLEGVKQARNASRSREKMAGSNGGGAPDDQDDITDSEEKFFDPAARYGIGIELRYIGKRFVVTSVAEQSTARIAGVKPGYILEKINGLALDDLVTKTIIDHPNSREFQHLLPLAIVNWFLNSRYKTAVELTCLDENDKPREFSIARLALAGRAISFGDRFPPEYFEYSSSALGDDVGYIKFNLFALPVLEKFCTSLSEFAAKKALIIDLRGNSGGLLATLYPLGGMLTDRPVSFGTSIYRRGSEELKISPKVKHFTGRVIVLVDEQSMSAAELFSAGLQESARAVVIGERTAGLALPAVTVRLATGAMFEYPVANFKTAKGKTLEGSGIEPDISVIRDRRSLLDGRDPPLEKALDIIKNNPTPSVVAAAKPPDTGDVPPPPLKELTRVTVKGKPVRPAPRLPVTKDPRAVAVMNDFANAVGGAAAYQRLLSYEAVGNGTVGAVGDEEHLKVHIFSQKPDKVTLVIRREGIGDVRIVYSPEGSFQQTEYGIDTPINSKVDVREIDLFEGVRNALDPGAFRWLAYDGIFEDEGRKLNVIEARDSLDRTMAMTFDVRTKMLVRLSYPGYMYTLSDFRKVDYITLPFSIKLDGIVNVQLDSVKLNPVIQPETFKRNLNCFDKPI